MRCRTLAATLALAALALPSALAEDPVITVPRADPAGPSASAQVAADDAVALAGGGADIATATPSVVFARCPAPTPPDPPQCDALAIPTDEAALFLGLAGGQGAALIGDAAALLGVSADAVQVVVAKAGETGDVVSALLQVDGPAATSALLVVATAAQAAAGGVLGDSAEGAGALSEATRGLLLEVDAGATCAGAQALVASLSPDAGDALDCASLPAGGAVVALLPA
jgi:hypothetical protein